MIDLFTNGNERTLLMWACATYKKHNNISLIRSLLKNHNANVNAQGTGGVTAVHIAIDAGLARLVAVLRFLVEEGRANLELRTRHGRIALHFACGNRNSNEYMVRCLLDNNADVNAPCGTGSTPLHKAAFHGKFRFARLLLADDRVNMEAIDEEGCTPLHIACHKGNTEIVELLLSNGANPNAVNHKRCTPLMYAAQSKNTTCAGVLIKAGVDLNAGDINGHTALHHAAFKGNVHVVEQLLKAKADWSATDNRNRMPVEMVKAEHREPVESLFMETLIGMVQKYQAFRDTIIRGITQEMCLLQALEPDVVPHIAGYCDVPMGDALEKVRLELYRLRSGRRGHKWKHIGI